MKTQIKMNKEEFKARKREISHNWYLKNKEKKIKYTLDYFKKHPEQREKTRERNRKNRKNNRAEYNFYMRKLMRKRLGLKPQKRYQNELTRT